MQYSTLKKEYSISCKDFVRLVILPDGNFQVLVDNSQSGLTDLKVTEPSKDLEAQNKQFYYLVNQI